MDSENEWWMERLVEGAGNGVDIWTVIPVSFLPFYLTSLFVDLSLYVRLSVQHETEAYLEQSNLLTQLCLSGHVMIRGRKCVSLRNTLRCYPH